MRLTLRAMLAYLDDMLEPADVQAVSQKIEASPFATDLMHRVHDVSRRLKLGAPKLTARGLTGDPNTVAEYLDNMLPAEQVAEFEKLCLQSDVSLAEVASAHQILALVLGEPAEIDPKLRRRMYVLPEQELQRVERGERPEDALHDDQDEELVTVEPGPRRRRRPEIPEWLRDTPKPRNYWLPMGIAAGLLFVLGLGGYLYISGGQSPAQVAAVDSSEEQQSEPPHAAAKAPAVAATSRATQSSEPVRSAPSPSAVADDSPREGLQNSEPGDADLDAPEPAPLADSVAESGDETDRPAEHPLRSGDDEKEMPARRADESVVVAERGLPPANMPPDPFDTDVPAERPAALEDQDLVVGGGKAQRGDAAAPAPVAVGRLISDTDIMLHATAEDGAWRRLSSGDTLVAGEEMLALPTFRPSIAFSSGGGAIVHLLGGTLVRLLGPDANGVPGVLVIEGEVVVSTTGNPGTQLNLQIDGETYLFTFVGPDARMAVDVHRTLPDGADPLEEPAQTSAELYVPSGQVEYSSATQALDTVKAPAFRPLTGRNPQAETEGSTEITFPAWINGNPLSQLEGIAVKVLEKELVPNQPVQVSLRELAENKRVEVRNLAVLCMTQLGDFEALLALLEDVNQRSYWSNHIEAVHRVLARDPQMAQQLKATLENQRDAKKAKDLYEMLRGYSKRQLQDGAASRLVADLDNEDLACRVLAFWNLQRVSVGTLGYRPEFTPEKRQKGVRAWRLKLADGQIVPKSAG